MTTGSSHTSAGSFKQPPVFIDGQSYGRWKKDTLMWSQFIASDMDKKTHGPVVYLRSFLQNPTAKDIVAVLEVDELNTENGLQLIFDKLDIIYKGEEHSSVSGIFRI